MNSSSIVHSDETQSVTCPRIKTRSRSVVEPKPFDTQGELRSFTKLIFLNITNTKTTTNLQIKYLDIDEPYSKSISDKAFYLDAVKELSSLIHCHRQTLFTSSVSIDIKFSSAMSNDKSFSSCATIEKSFTSGNSNDDQFNNPMRPSHLTNNSNQSSPKVNRSTQPSNLNIFASSLHSIHQPSTDSSDFGDSSGSDCLENHDKASPSSISSSNLSTVDELTPLENPTEQLLLAITTQNVDLAAVSLQQLSPQTLLSYRDPLCQRTFLHLACEKGSPSIVLLLLDFHFDLNIVDNTGKSCLHLTENAEVVKLLCEKGANCNLLDLVGHSPLHGYAFKENRACIEAILPFGANPELLTSSTRWSCLLMAASVGSADVINLLISSCPAGSIRFDHTDVEDNTALHLAASCERINGDQCKAILLLLHRGVSITARNKYGQAVLHLLCANRSLIHSPFCEPTIEMLLNMEADPNCQDLQGCTPLAIAVVCRAWTLCFLLLDAGADLNIPFNMNSPFLATLHTSTVSNGTKSAKSGDMELDVAMQKKMKESDCTANDLLPRSVRKDMYSRINVPQTRIPLELRDRCMNCAVSFDEERERKALESSSSFFSSLTSSISSTTVKFHCSMCSRVVCDKCSSYEVNRHSMPEFLQQSNERTMQVCLICYGIIKEKDGLLRSRGK